jgi:phenolic acid decarboxylase
MFLEEIMMRDSMIETYMGRHKYHIYIKEQAQISYKLLHTSGSQGKELW